MTVQELIEALQKVENKNADVWAAGCDCCNQVSEVVQDEFYEVLLEVSL